jgi:hypothetical protein
VDVFTDNSSGARTLISAIFWEGLSAGSAVTALLRAGFSDTDVYAVGVLAGMAPDLSDFLASLGIPASDTLYYNDCLQDGGVLLIIRAHTPGDERRAFEVILRHGGIFPPSCELLNAAAQ